MAEFNFSCGRCGQRIVADLATAGLTADCPNCRQPLTIPIPGMLSEWEESELRDFFPGEEVRSDAFTELARLQEQFEAVTLECDHLSAAGVHTRAELKTFLSERLILHKELSQARQRLSVAVEQLAARDQTVEQLQAASALSAAVLESLSGDLVLAQQAAVAAQTQLDMEAQNLRKMNGLYSGASEERNALRVQCEGHQKEIALLKDELLASRETKSRLNDTEGALALARVELLEAGERFSSLVTDCERKNAQTAELERDLELTQGGRELKALREQLVASQQAGSFSQSQLKQITEQAELSAAARKELEALLDTVRQQLAQAEEVAEANSTSRFRVDNDLLRGIIVRQNAELERWFAEVVSFKRARIGLRMIYGLIALGLIALALGLIEVFPAVFTAFSW